MINITTYINDKKSKKSYIVISISSKSSRLKLSTGISVLTELWDSHKNKIKPKHPNYSALNRELADQVSNINDLLTEYKLIKPNHTFEEFKEFVVMKLRHPEKIDKRNVL